MTRTAARGALWQYYLAVDSLINAAPSESTCLLFTGSKPATRSVSSDLSLDGHWHSLQAGSLSVQVALVLCQLCHHATALPVVALALNDSVASLRPY